MGQRSQPTLTQGMGKRRSPEGDVGERFVLASSLAYLCGCGNDSAKERQEQVDSRCHASELKRQGPVCHSHTPKADWAKELSLFFSCRI